MPPLLPLSNECTKAVTNWWEFFPSFIEAYELGRELMELFFFYGGALWPGIVSPAGRLNDLNVIAHPAEIAAPSDCVCLPDETGGDLARPPHRTATRRRNPGHAPASFGFRKIA